MTPLGRSYQIVPWLDEQLGTVRIFGLLLGSLAKKDRGRQLPSASCFSSAGHFTCLNARHSLSSKANFYLITIFELSTYQHQLQQLALDSSSHVGMSLTLIMHLNPLLFSKVGRYLL